MSLERVAIVAGPAALATARAYREHGGEAEVTLIGREPLPPYERPPLTKGLPHLVTHPDGAFTVWYERGGAAVGVLTHERDEDCERGREIVRAGQPIP